MILGAIEAALRATGRFRRIDGVLALADLATEPHHALPAAFVIPDTASAQDAAMGSAVFEQIVTRLVGVVIVVGADGARRGPALADIEELEGVVIDALAALVLEGADRPLTFADSRLVGVGAGRVSVLLRFRAVNRIRVLRAP